MGKRRRGSGTRKSTKISLDRLQNEKVRREKAGLFFLLLLLYSLEIRSLRPAVVCGWSGR